MSETAAQTPGQVLDQLLAEAGDIQRRGDDYLRDGRPFAACREPSRVELRLGVEIVEAALRTPDTGASSRGDDWVDFTPHEWDQHSIDRLRAWFRVAWRSVRRDG